MALLYILLSISSGAGIVLCLKTYWQPRIQSLNRNRIVSPSFLFLPSSYLTGTLVLTWLTYFSATAFRNSGSPLLYANIISMTFSVVFLLIIAVFKRSRIKRFLHEVRKYGLNINLKTAEWFIIFSSALFWTFFICRSFYLDGNFLHVGFSAFSDFGAHLPVIRSFSAGKNFPARYPHFPDGSMRYHFMFYFLAGNLEYLGLTLPQALNIPSILSLVSFSMLLYALAAFLTGKAEAGILSCFLFAFRSSFAFFTFISGFSNIKDFIYAVSNNRNADGSSREHIGNTLHEDWGLWAQKVYINQRHLAFALGIFIIVLFLMLPLFIETAERIRKSVKSRNANQKTKRSSFLQYIKMILFSGEAWKINALVPCILAGTLFGLIAFWNGAVVIAGISVLFIMAALSCHKLEYLITAVFTFVFSVLQSRIFAGSGTGVVSVKYTPGFLAESGSLNHILSYYIELLGILPFVLAGIYIFHAAKRKKWAGLVLSAVPIVLLTVYMPYMEPVWAVLTVFLCLLLYSYLCYRRDTDVQRISLWLVPVFIAPIILATTLQLTPDVTVNHKYIILSVILLNIPASDLLSGLFKRGKTGMIISLCLVLFLTCTGIIDMFTLYNLDKNSVSYNEKDPLKIWAENETNPDDIFLTHYMTHYGAPMSIMLAGRSVYNGYPYFTVTAGYDISHREECMRKIYSAAGSDELRALAVSEGIDYIVIEDQNRTATEYDLNEEIFYKTFDVAFKNNNVTVFKVQ